MPRAPTNDVSLAIITLLCHLPEKFQGLWWTIDEYCDMLRRGLLVFTLTILCCPTPLVELSTIIMETHVCAHVDAMTMFKASSTSSVSKIQHIEAVELPDRWYKAIDYIEHDLR
jgi:hypothetical protein